MKKMSWFITFVVILALNSYASAATELVRNSSDTAPYELAQRLFAENEDCFRKLCQQVLERETDQLDIRYEKDDNNEYDIQVWEKRGDAYEQSSVSEYRSLLNLEYDRTTYGIRLPVFNVVRREGVVDIALWTYPNFEEPLRNNRHGFYFVDCDCCENAALEDVLEKHMNEAWAFRMATEDEYELELLSEQFIYYHWRG